MQCPSGRISGILGPHHARAARPPSPREQRLPPAGRTPLRSAGRCWPARSPKRSPRSGSTTARGYCGRANDVPRSHEPHPPRNRAATDSTVIERTTARNSSDNPPLLNAPRRRRPSTRTATPAPGPRPGPGRGLRASWRSSLCPRTRPCPASPPTWTASPLNSAVPSAASSPAPSPQPPRGPSRKRVRCAPGVYHRPGLWPHGPAPMRHSGFSAVSSRP